MKFFVVMCSLLFLVSLPGGIMVTEHVDTSERIENVYTQALRPEQYEQTKQEVANCNRSVLSDNKVALFKTGYLPLKTLLYVRLRRLLI